jgi:O-antigen ligase
LLLLMVTAGTLTQARSAMAAMITTIPLFIGMWIWRRYRETKSKSDLVAPAMLSAFPFAALMLVIMVVVHPRVRVMVLGGSGTQASTDARKAQWDMAIPQIVKNPVGYGMGTSERVVPYYNFAGKFTIDSYPINLLVEYGVLGFLAFTGFFALAAGMGVRVYLHARNEDELVAGAAAVGIIAFMIVRLILSTEGGQDLAFGYAGLILGLWYRQRKRERAA